jgi:hypothetical protein
MTALLLSPPLPFAVPSCLKFNILDLDRWNLTNSTLIESESLRSLSDSGDHCASFSADFLPP